MPSVRACWSCSDMRGMVSPNSFYETLQRVFGFVVGFEGSILLLEKIDPWPFPYRIQMVFRCIKIPTGFFAVVIYSSDSDLQDDFVSVFVGEPTFAKIHPRIKSFELELFPFF